MKDKILNNEIIKTILPILKKHNVFLVGGFLRDLYLGKNSCDIDLIVSDISPENLADELIKNLDATKVLLDKENEIFRIAIHNSENYIDITKPIENDLIKDIQRRDFTINSLFFDINEEKIFDPFNFIEDFEKKIIRTYSLKNLEDDPLRLLRAFRFQSILGFEISDGIKHFIAENGNLLKKVASERVNYEILKTFEGDYLVESLNGMCETKLLSIIFPILEEVEKIPPNTHHHLPLIKHCIETVKNIRINKPILKISALLHDIGKPSTWTIDNETKRHRFIGHEKVGAELAKKLLEDLKFSRKQIVYITKMIENHIYPSQLMSSDDKTENAMMRFVRKLEPDIEDVIELARADRLSARGEAVTDEMVKNNLEGLNELLCFYEEIKPTLIDLPKLIDGNEIMKIRKIKGRDLGVIINALKEKQILGHIKTKEDAIKFIQEFDFNKP